MFYTSNHPPSEELSNTDPEGWQTRQVPYSDTHSSASSYPSLETDTWSFNHIIGDYAPSSSSSSAAGWSTSSIPGPSPSPGLSPSYLDGLSPLTSLDSESESEPESDHCNNDPRTPISQSRCPQQGRGYGPTPGAPPPNPLRSLINSTPSMPTTPTRVPRRFRCSHSRVHPRPRPGLRPSPNARPIPLQRPSVRSLPSPRQPQPPTPSPCSRPRLSPRHACTSHRNQDQNQSAVQNQGPLPIIEEMRNPEQSDMEVQHEDELGDADAEGDTDEEYLGDEDAQGDIDEEYLGDEDAEGDPDEEWLGGDEDAEGDVDEEWFKSQSGQTSDAFSH